ncbi:GNAT family N-acetyltransferase [Magnetospira sp. QH-2]|uniref:GNAT family N-acetyltransferase n=1 Tax=Magnetospira sp. (strain QH-2) TaxID=1288970 RepID=UPI0003E81B8B|nr:GNAT family N-acetyltransferase [Magnetospira sp. QH-2]CCQ72977.1 conserved protein of unknown function [Magnetospira sp. QH-2]
MSYQVTRFDRLADLPEQASALLHREGSFFSSWTWYRCLIDEACAPGDGIHFYAVADDNQDSRCLLLLPALSVTGGKDLVLRTVGSLTNVYTVLWEPLYADNLANPKAALDALVDHLCARESRWEHMSFRAMEKDTPSFDWLVAALHRNGWAVQPYFQYANIYESITDPDSATYLSRRGSSIRKTLLRMERKAERSGAYHHVMHTGPEGLDRAIADYELIYAASWKQPEAKPDFMRSLIRAAAEEGSLRLGLVYWDDKPVAEQLSFVRGGRASMYKTAYDEDYKKQALGRLSLLHLMRHVIDEDHVHEVDFGIGAEPYKEEWLFQRRDLWGLAAYNPKTLRGALGAARHVLAPKIKKALLSR